MCQKEQGMEDPKSWLLSLIFPVSQWKTFSFPQLPKQGPSENNDQISRRSESPQVIPKIRAKAPGPMKSWTL